MMLVFNPRHARFLYLTLARAQEILDSGPQKLWVFNVDSASAESNPEAPSRSVGRVISPGDGRLRSLGSYWDSYLYHIELDQLLRAFVGNGDGDREFLFALEGDEIVVTPPGESFPGNGKSLCVKVMPDGPINEISFAEAFRDLEFVEEVASRGILLPPPPAKDGPKRAKMPYAFGAVVELASGVVLTTVYPENLTQGRGYCLIHLRRRDVAERLVRSAAASRVKPSSEGLLHYFYDPEISLDLLSLTHPPLDELFAAPSMQPLITELGLSRDDVREYVWQREPKLWMHRLT